jgi:lipoprotein-anchoring transpeptidase ErfK/SrfK
MGLGIQPGEAGYDGVGENSGAVAARQAAPVQPLAEQEGVLERVVVVRGKQLVPLPGISGDDEWYSADAHTSARRRHPERGVPAAEQKLGARRRGLRFVAGSRRRARGDDDGKGTRDGAATAAR